MQLPLYQVNAFTRNVYGGNPAGVCPLTYWLDDATLQAIAFENGYAETAFFVAEGDDYRLRWFTPGCEVNLCGHATLATAWTLRHELGDHRERLVFHTRSGAILVDCDDGGLTLDMPANRLEPVDVPECVRRGLGMHVVEAFAADDYLVVVDSAAALRAAAPDLAEMAKIDRRGTIVTALGDVPGVDFVSRWFGSAHVQVPEDPVTGSAHCSLMPYWSKRLGKLRCTALQVSARGGELQCELVGDRVRIAGQAVKYLAGSIFVQD
ncbi:MAG: PhzF family phenazine biosynthesis protein [Collimonas sp.]|uniref:PhzF family phenazine biosynthesis protein n=1 Tax=Collimonas sp. TaxID=1963772 RepID=UPI00326360B1